VTFEHPGEEWVQLHHRVVRGETLTAEERAYYEEKMRQLDESESYPGAIERLRVLEAELERLRQQESLLRQQLAAADAEFEELRRRFRERTGKELIPAAR
jgi:SMC interacting uncharacterized protein involved in chromosome segregation